MSWGDSSDLEILGGVSGELQDFGSQVFEDSSTVNCGGSSDTILSRDSALQESVNSSDGELES